MAGVFEATFEDHDLSKEKVEEILWKIQKIFDDLDVEAVVSFMQLKVDDGEEIV